MKKLLLTLMLMGATFAFYEPEELEEKQRIRQDVESFIKWEQQNEEEEELERKNIKLMMDQFFLKEEFEAFQKKNQKTNEDILSRLKDLEEKDKLKNETILNLQNKVDKLEDELFKKFDAFSDEILEKVVPVKEEDEELFDAFKNMVIDANEPLPLYICELFATKIVSKIKNKERLEFLSDTYDKLFPFAPHIVTFFLESNDMNYVRSKKNEIKLKTLGVCALNKVNSNNMDKFCQFVDHINNFSYSRSVHKMGTTNDIINPNNIGDLCEFEIEKLDIIKIIFDKINASDSWKYYNTMSMHAPDFHETIDQLILLAKHSTIEDLKKIESELPQKNIRNFTNIIQSFK